MSLVKPRYRRYHRCFSCPRLLYISISIIISCILHAQVSGDTSYASLVKSKQGDSINDSSVAASPLLQHDDKNHDQLPLYVNIRSANYENVQLDG